ncbi:ABC transporter ATP-binding protein [Tepidibacter thalassicus]|uniref:Iron complex transport system ATP-binding protein n=1 Tax=Tepidibacter thalassicus DSM 15285 TaxID=1123350 RepID=A0A1M5QRC2_9FIRM|nr:ABC transporter ATP-binding protein [Tepidibacter thalassicus]SHH16476.1 iron complex transport system ATP-binding protein [Tepidibacter thalassicus DSM 15285]
MINMKISNIGVSFQNKTVLKDISAVLKGGELTSIIGPNGTGKTTLIKSIARLIKSRGDVVLTDSHGNSLSKNSIAYVPQMSTTTTELSVFEMVLLGRVKDLTWKVEKHHIDAVTQMLKDLGLLSLSYFPFCKLSGGQRQLVTMAQALVSKPKVLLLDEPTSALDLRHQLQVLDIAQQYTKQTGAITLVVLHDLALVARYSDNILLLHDGKIVKKGLPKDVLDPNLLQEVYKVEVDVSVSNGGYTTVTPIRPIIPIRSSIVC